MKQVVNIKKVAIDSELKVTVQVEFIAANTETKQRVFDLIGLQGDIVEVEFQPAQQSLPLENGDRTFASV